MKDSLQTRETYYDSLKFMLMTLVILGHSIDLSWGG